MAEEQEDNEEHAGRKSPATTAVATGEVIEDLPPVTVELRPVTVVRAKRDTFYEVKDFQLDLLEKGSPESLELIFGIALCSLFASGVLTLLTATFSTDTAKTVAIVITVVAFIIGAFLLARWRRARVTAGTIIKAIRAAPAPAGEPDQQTRGAK